MEEGEKNEKKHLLNRSADPVHANEFRIFIIIHFNGLREVLLNSIRSVRSFSSMPIELLSSM